MTASASKIVREAQGPHLNGWWRIEESGVELKAILNDFFS